MCVAARCYNQCVLQRGLASPASRILAQAAVAANPAVVPPPAAAAAVGGAAVAAAGGGAGGAGMLTLFYPIHNLFHKNLLERRFTLHATITQH